MPISIANLIAEIDPNDVLLNPLDACLVKANKKKHETEFSFVSDASWGMGPSFQIRTDKQGLVLWLDREEVQNILANQPAKPTLVPEKHENHFRLLRTALEYLVEKGAGSDVAGPTQDELITMLDKVDDLFSS